MGQFSEALNTTGEDGRTHWLRRRNGEQMDHSILENALEFFERRLGRTATMHALERGPRGVRGAIKIKPELLPEEEALLREVGLAIETGADSSFA